MLRIITLIFNRATGALTADSLGNLTRGDGYMIHLFVVNGSSPELLPENRNISLAIKKRGEDALLAGNVFFLDPVELGRPYVGTLVLRSDAMTEAFENLDGTNLKIGQERDFIAAKLELEIYIDGDYPTTAQKLDVEISNEFLRGEVMPPPPDPLDPWEAADARYLRPGQDVSQLLNDAGYITSNSVHVQEFRTSGVWHKPENAVKVMVIMCSGGGGGGSGAWAESGSFRYGGTGGGSGGIMVFELIASALNNTESVEVGAGGMGAVPAFFYGAAGNNGGAGGNTVFAGITVQGGNAGIGGKIGTASNGGAALSGYMLFPWSTGFAVGAAGGSNNVRDGNPTLITLANYRTPCSGAAGATLSDGNIPIVGGRGGGGASGFTLGAMFITAPGGAAGTDSSTAEDGADSKDIYGGGRGGGGGYLSSKGGDGGFPSAGGGGGGAALSDPTGIAYGGKGGDGYVLIITYKS